MTFRLIIGLSQAMSLFLNELQMKNNQIKFYLDQESCLCRVSSCLYRVIHGFELTNRGMVVRLVDTSQILVNEHLTPIKLFVATNMVKFQRLSIFPR